MVYKFVSAKATNTRMMGVVGVVAYWLNEKEEDVTQIYHLDYESGGIDGYTQYIGEEEVTIEKTILGMTGGLGGDFVDISYEEFSFLIKSAYHENEFSIELLVDFDFFYDAFMSLFEMTPLSNENERLLYKKLCPDINDPITLIHYFLMRVVGNDFLAAGFFWENKEVVGRFKICKEPYTLLKETTTLIESTAVEAVYVSEALIDFEDRYRLVKSMVKISKKTLKIISAEITNEMNVSAIEASFNLNKSEYMSIVRVEDDFFEKRFCYQNPEIMHYDYYNGTLYIEFNANNDHVSDNPYYLNGDLYALYFFTREKYLIISSFNHGHIKEINALFEENELYDASLNFICELKIDSPILYTFINSPYDNIFDFLDNYNN